MFPKCLSSTGRHRLERVLLPKVPVYKQPQGNHAAHCLWPYNKNDCEVVGQMHCRIYPSVPLPETDKHHSSGGPWLVSREASFGSSVHSNPKRDIAVSEGHNQCQKIEETQYPRSLTLSTHGALTLGRVLFYPLEDAVLEFLASLVSLPSRKGSNIRNCCKPCESCGRICQILPKQCQRSEVDRAKKGIPQLNSHSGQSSPGYLHVGHVPSK